MSNVVAIYVGQAGLANLTVGLGQGIWGFKKNLDDLARIAPGDVVLLASGGGSPRVQSGVWSAGRLSSIEIGVVTQGLYEDRTPVWPDEHTGENSYPYRFRFEQRKRVVDIALGETGPLGPMVADALRVSGNSQGRAFVLANPPGFTLDVSAAGGPPPPPPPPPPPVSTVAPAPARPPAPAATAVSVESLVVEFERQLDDASLRFQGDLAMRFLCGLLTKPFVIFTGLSGSGKTQLAIALGRWLGEERLHVAAVRPDWTGAEALFGYENLLLPPSQDGRAAWSVPAELRFMLRAADDPDEPYLLLLDEMNLAHVERYFADVLSGMESGAPVLPNLALEEDGTWRVARGADARLPFPRNLLIVGTVNVDETTYQFSPKVLDRASTIEVRVTTDSLVGRRPDLTRLRRASAAERSAFVERPTDDPINSLPSELLKGIEELHRLLARHGREFGHRTFQEMLRFAGFAFEARPAATYSTVLDYLVMQKVLPRVHGSARELGGIMASLRSFAGPDGRDDADPAVDRLPISAEKLGRMAAELDATHFTAF